MIHYVYTHAKPDTEDEFGIFYVGKGIGRRARRFAGRSPYHKNMVAKYGKENIIVRIVKEFEKEVDALAYEIELINKLKGMNIELVNFTDGGEGWTGAYHSEETKLILSEKSKGNKNCIGRVYTEQMRLNMSIAQKNSPKKEAANKSQSEKKKGKKQSAETIEKRIAPLRGIKKSPEFCANLSLKMKGRIFTEEQKINMSNGQKNSEKAKENFKKVIQSNIGRKRSSDFKDKLSIRFKNVPKSEEHKRKISEAHTGKKRSFETRQKMVEAHARRKEKKIQDSLNVVLSNQEDI